MLWNSMGTIQSENFWSLDLDIINQIIMNSEKKLDKLIITLIFLRLTIIILGVMNYLMDIVVLSFGIHYIFPVCTFISFIILKN